MNIDLKYERLLEIFEEISKIPRNSTKEEQIAKYVCSFAKNLELQYKIDDYYNVIVKKPSSKGLENSKKIMFQAHLDMVCEKTIESNHNFDTDPIEIIKSSNVYGAKNTTLGADDGIGVSILLLLMESDDIELPESYFVFTTQEETGMDGAKYIDLSDINIDYLINLDSEEENSVIVGCAGGLTLTFEKEDNLFDIYDSVYELSISGLKGGHSGVDIDKGRMNAIYLGATIISKLEGTHLISFEGGSKTNVIPGSSKVIFSCKSNTIEDDINSIIEEVKLSTDDKDAKINVKKLEGSYKGLSELSTEAVIKLLLNLKQNVISKEEIVETSGNVAIIDMKEGKTKVVESLRSNVTEKLNLYKDENIELANSLEFIIRIGEEYPGWDCNPKSKLTDMYIKAYQKTHENEKPLVTSIHAGLECGMLKEKLPNVDTISIGPDLEEVHTVNERLYLDSCKKLLSTLIELFELLK